MRNESRAPGRVVPTLTEIVEPASAVPAAPASTPSEGEWVQIIMRQLRQEGDARLLAMVHRHWQEQTEQLARKLLPEIESLVRQRVAQELEKRLGKNAGDDLDRDFS